MINSLRGSRGSLKAQSSCTQIQPSLPKDSTSQSSSTLPCPDTSTPPSLEYTSPRFDLVDNPMIDSPTTALLASLLSSDQMDGPDFMICSPLRTLLSPESASACNYNHAQAMQGQSVSGCSPPRFASQLGCSFSGARKERGLGPLQRVLNSARGRDQVIAQSDCIPLDFLEDYIVKDEFGGYPMSGPVPGFGTVECFDVPTTTTASLEMPNASRFRAGLAKEVIGEDYTNETCREIADFRDVKPLKSATTLSEQLRREDCQEEQQQSSFVVPIPTDSEQVIRTMWKRFNASESPITTYVLVQQEQDSGLQLVHLLLACAEAVSKGDDLLARKYLNHLYRVVTPIGDSTQRVASFFTEALNERLASGVTTTKSSKPSRLPSPVPPDSLEIHKIYQILYQACPYVKFAHFTANQAIFEAFADEERLRVIDLDILRGYQWPSFMQALAARPGGPPFLRITGVGPCVEMVSETGRCLAELAHSLHLPFEFHPVGEQLEELKQPLLHRRIGEALAVNSVNRLHRDPGICLGSLLAMIRDQAPNIVTLVEQEASHNGPYFLSRFLEALHYYSAIFDSLDATFPPNSLRRAKVEQLKFAPEIRNIVACEGPERTERHERLEKWRKVMEGTGFTGVPLSENALAQSKTLVNLYSCRGYSLREDMGCLLLGWQDRAIVAASAWRCL